MSYHFARGDDYSRLFKKKYCYPLQAKITKLIFFNFSEGGKTSQLFLLICQIQAKFCTVLFKKHFLMFYCATTCVYIVRVVKSKCIVLSNYAIFEKNVSTKNVRCSCPFHSCNLHFRYVYGLLTYLSFYDRMYRAALHLCVFVIQIFLIDYCVFFRHPKK